MEEPLAEQVRRLVAGDVARLASVYAASHADLLEAVNDEKLVVTAGAAAGVLGALLRGEISDDQARRWAFFVRRGFVGGWSTEPDRSKSLPRGLDIEYDPHAEEAIAEAVSRLDELGDTVDGEVSPQELRDLLAQLGENDR